MPKTIDEKFDYLVTAIDTLDVNFTKRIDNAIEDFGAMVAREFNRVNKNIANLDKRVGGVEKEIKSMNKMFDRHYKEAENIHEKLNKRVVILERLQNI